MPDLGRVFITGAAGGLGRAFAKYYASKGYSLALTDVRAEALEEAVRALDPCNVDVRTVVADLSTRDGLETALQAVRQCDDLEILINNAGLGGGSKLFDNPLDLYAAQFDVNALAPLSLSLEAETVMRVRERGFIINVASAAGLHPGYRDMNYSCTKAYLIFLSKTMQVFVADSPIKIQALCPGLVDTDINPPGYKRMYPSFCWTPAAKVVAMSHRALGKKRVVLLPGLNNHVTMFFWKVGLARYYYAVLRRWDRLLCKLNMLPPIPEQSLPENRAEAHDPDRDV